jgi:hypothetical protein
VTLEIFMFGIKGYRAREAAAKLRNNRNLVSEEVRAARYAVLPDKVAQPKAEVEVPVTDEQTAAAEAAEKAAAEAAEKEAAEAAEKAAAEAAAKEAAEKEAADRAAADEGKASKKKK